MKRHMVWELDATMGAVHALQDNHKACTHEVMERAEQLAIERSKVDKYEAAIITEDVIQAVRESGVEPIQAMGTILDEVEEAMIKKES